MHYGGSTGNYTNLFSEHSNPQSDTKSTIRDLEARLNKAELITEALWGILKEKANLSEVDLIERMMEVDLLDGILDGKKKKVSAFECPKCGRKNSKRHMRCLYCGDAFLVGPFE